LPNCIHLPFYFPFSFHQKKPKYYPRSDCGWQRQSKFWSLSYIVRLFLASWPHLFLVKTHPTTFEHGEKFVLVYIILLLLELVRWLRWFMYISYAMNGTHAHAAHRYTTPTQIRIQIHIQWAKSFCHGFKSARLNVCNTLVAHVVLI